MTIRLDQKNSKLIGGKVFITAIKAHKLNQKLSPFVLTESKINHPSLGIMYEYTGPYTRKV
jgi:hypothetical protein